AEADITRGPRSARCRHCSVGLTPWLWVLRHLPCVRATRRLPKLCGCSLPIESVIAWTMLLQVFHARNSLLDARPMTSRHPQQHDGWPLKMLKPIGAAAIEALMDCLPDKALKCLDALPN